MKTITLANRDNASFSVAGRRPLLDELRDQGDLDLHELSSSEPIVLKELVRSLFLYCYARALRPS